MLQEHTGRHLEKEVRRGSLGIGQLEHLAGVRTKYIESIKR